MNNDDLQKLADLQAKIVKNWVDACEYAEYWGDEIPYPVFLTVDEFIDLSRGEMNVH